MTIQVSWDAQLPDVLIYELGTEWRWDEFLDAKDRAETMIDAAQRPIYVIFHAPDLVQLPPDFHRMLNNVLSALHPYTKGLLLVGAPPFIRGFFDNLNRRRQSNSLHYFHMVNTLEDAYHLIESRRSGERITA